MPDYSKGKIYKIVNGTDDEIYVGSTIESLCQRMAKHRCKVKTTNYILYKHMNLIGIDKFSIELIEYFPCNTKEELRAKEGEWIRKIGTLNNRIAGRSSKVWYDDNKAQISQKNKEYRQHNLEEVRAKDREYRNNNIDRERERDRERYNNEERRNKVKTRVKNWKEEHQEYVKEKDKEWRENNREKKQETDRQYRINNKDKLNENQKLWREENRDKIKETNKEYREKHKDMIKEKNAQKVVCECGCEVRKYDLPRHKKTDKHNMLLKV